MSQCSKCGLPKEGNRDKFYARAKPSEPGKLRNDCKACVKSRVRKNASRPEAVSRRRIAARTHQGRWLAAKREAKRRGLNWSIDLPTFCYLNMSACDYCGGALPETGCGLDRIDNTCGYSEDNVTPCCEWCNVARSDHFTWQEMKLFVGPAIRQIRESRVTK